MKDILLSCRSKSRGHLKPNSEAGLQVAATPRRRKVLATPSSPVGAASFPVSEKMRRGRRRHTVVTRRRRYPRRATSVFGIDGDVGEALLPVIRRHFQLVTVCYQFTSLSGEFVHLPFQYRFACVEWVACAGHVI